MEIQQLRHLIAAVQYGNLLKAAEESHISQSGLSRSIKSLETRLGVPLLVRKSTGVEPTVFGLSLIRRAHVIISEAAHSVREIRAIEQAQIGEVTLGITPNYAHHLIPKVLADITSDRPAVRLTVVAASFLHLIEKLKVGDVDFAFGFLGAIEESPDVRVEEVTDSYSRVIASSRHPLVRKGNVGLDDLALARWAMLCGEGFQRNFLNFFYCRGQTIPAQALKTDSIALLKRVVMGGDLLTILPEDAVGAEIESGDLVPLACETPAEYARVGFVFRVESLVTPQMQLLIDSIRSALLAVPRTVSSSTVHRPAALETTSTT
jgi:DNA-binding transcriptional LysR family regulator